MGEDTEPEIKEIHFKVRKAKFDKRFTETIDSSKETFDEKKSLTERKGRKGHKDTITYAEV